MKTTKLTYKKALDIVEKLSTKHGFLASSVNVDNYKRIFSRDGIIIGLATLMTNNTAFHNQFKKTLLTLKKFQGPVGEIPSNVCIKPNKISYGTTTGRVDATLWYVIGNIQYFKHTNNLDFLKTQFKSLEKCMHLLHSWEFNNRGMIYVPLGGDWADEYINQGYVLYDELLYLQAIKDFTFALNALKKSPQQINKYNTKAKKLKKILQINFWPLKKNKNSKSVYHKEIFENIQTRKNTNYFISSFYPGGFNNQFDAFANSLAILFGIANDSQINQILNFINQTFTEKTKYLIPAFAPGISTKNKNWNILRTNYNYKFKNKIHQFHNGGLWPFTTGFLTIALMNIQNQKKQAQKYLEGITYAVKKENFGFYEYLDGKTFDAKGTKFLGFSAAAMIMTYQSVVNNKQFFM